MTPDQIAQLAAQKRATLARLHPVKLEHRQRAEGIRDARTGLKAGIALVHAEAKITAGHPLDLFPTPKPLAARLVSLCGVKQGDSVLEPSAGTGRLAEAIRNAGARVHCVELNYNAAQYLTAQGYTVDSADFMDWEPAAQFDAAILNPPFSNSQDIAHIQRAADFVKPGGMLGALLSPAYTFHQSKAAAAFRDWLESDAVSVLHQETLPPGTFRESGTNVNANLLIMRINQ